MWNVSSSLVDGSLSNKSMNQGVKGAHSEMRGSSQQSLSVNQSINDCHANLSDSVQKDSVRYSKDIASSLNTGFAPGSKSWQRNMAGNGTHSSGNYSSLGATSSESHKLSNYGAQYGNPTSNNTRAKSQVSESNYCNNNSPYAAWPGLNSTSTSSSNGWNFQNNMTKKNLDISNSSLTKDMKEEENMSVDGELSFSDLIGPSENADKKPESNSSHNSSYSQSRLGLLGGENTSWNPPGSTPNTWESNRQLTGTPSDNPIADNAEMMNQSSFSGLIGATGGSDLLEEKQGNEGYYKQEMQPPRLGLLGGGEGSMNAPGWGGPNSSGNGTSTWVPNGRSNSGNCDMGENNGSGMSPPKPHGSWAQAAGKGLNSCGSLNASGNNGQTSPLNTEQSLNTQSENSASDQKSSDVSINELKMKAATSEGWGQMAVNQDSPWDIPPSPPPAQGTSDASASNRDGSTQVWRTPVNNGTEIWQNNLNKVATTTVASTAPPWGHTPATNIGGHWGDDDSSANIWSGVGPPNASNCGGCWPESQPPQPMWNSAAPAPPVEKQWPGGNPAAAPSAAGPPWNDGGDSGAAVWNPPLAKQRNVGDNWSPVATPKKDSMPPSGWEMSPPQNRRAITGGYDDGTAVWGNPQRQGKVSNWKDMPPAKPIMSGSNGMGNPGGMPPMSMPGGMQSGQGVIRLSSGAAIGPKNDMGGPPWNRPPSMNRNSSWQDMPPHEGTNIGTWGEDAMHMKNVPGMGNASNMPFGWNDQNNAAYWGNKPKGPTGWAEGQVDTSSWLGPTKQGGKPLSRDLIWSCKQFRMLIEVGYKKDDVENALRNNNMSIDDAFYELRSVDPSVIVDVDSVFGRKVRPANANLSGDISMAEDVMDNSFGVGNFHGANNFQSSNYQNMSNMGAFKQQVKVPNNSNMSSNLGGQNSNIGNYNLLQKIIQQQQNSLQQQLNANSQINNQGGNRAAQNAHLRLLVQQIQMAIQAGYISPTILSHTLGPQTLQLVFQLLQQIKILHQLQQQLLHPKLLSAGGPNNASAQLNVQVTQTKQRIMNLQNQIAAQQAVLLKAQPVAHQGLHSSQSTDIFKPTMEAMPSLQSEFRDMSIKEVPLQAHQQSRLHQWKLPQYEKEDTNFCSQNASSLTEFSRAPGPLPSKTSSSASSTMPNPGPNLHPLLSQGDSAWSSLSRSQGDSGWPETSLSGLANSIGPVVSSVMDSKESSSTPPSSGPSTSSASHTSYSLNDLVPEFEPGKPWKGTQMKSIEDDPHITPGSMARSPLSVNTIKDTDLFWSAKPSPATTSGNDVSLASSTWNYTASHTTLTNSSSNKPGVKWSTDSGTDVWDSVPKARGPPPGMSSQGSWDRQTSSTFLLLRNLTPQIDGSTLKTLCIQHGPLQLFHLSLNHGIALVRYSSREEASKAQSALNNCVLGNTTILADIPNESEVQQYLVLLSNQNSASWQTSQPSSNTAAFRNCNNSGASYAYNSVASGGNSADSSKLDSSGWNGNNLNMSSPQLWAYPNSTNALWSSSQPLSEHESSTNSSLNRFLPDNLLGGESM